MQSIVVLFIMSLVVFTMINLVGDPVDMLVNPESLPDEIERVRSDFGLDQPAHIQYIKFLQGALSGDLGNSFIFGRPALALIAERFPARGGAAPGSRSSMQATTRGPRGEPKILWRQHPKQERERQEHERSGCRL